MSKTDLAPWDNPLTQEGLTLPQGLSPELCPYECGFMARTRSWRFTGVRSPFWRLYHNPRPGGAITSAGQRFPLTPGRWVLTPPFVRIDCEARDGTPHFWIHFGVEPPGVAWTRPVSVGLGRAGAALLDEVLGLLRRRSAGPALAARCDALIRLSLAAARPEPGTAPDPRLERVLAHLHREFARPCPNRELARIAGMSAEGFLRWFRERTSTTPHAYLTRRRLREASRRLLYTDETIDAIAVGVGFPNRHYFSRVFAAHLGDPPARFRRRGAAGGAGPE